MINMDLAKLAPEIAGLLLQRGSGLPPLVWHERQVPLAKTTLDNIDDASLFDGANLADQGLATAIRAMLYLWTGWPDGCRTHAQDAGEAEHHFLIGLCERQSGNAAEAKRAFQQFDGHPIYPSLASYVPEAVGVRPDAHLRRFADITKLGGTWEPFAFVDLYNQALARNVSRATEEVVCALQCREFELLFDYCYQGSTGQTTEAEPQQAAPTRPKRNIRPTRRQTRRPQVPAPTQQTPAKAKKKPLPPPPVTVIGLLCPKCRAMNRVPKTARGKTTRCQQCGTRFKVPDAKPPSAATPAPEGTAR